MTVGCHCKFKPERFLSEMNEHRGFVDWQEDTDSDSDSRVSLQILAREISIRDDEWTRGISFRDWSSDPDISYSSVGVRFAAAPCSHLLGRRSPGTTSAEDNRSILIETLSFSPPVLLRTNNYSICWDTVKWWYRKPYSCCTSTKAKLQILHIHQVYTFVIL